MVVWDTGDNSGDGTRMGFVVRALFSYRAVTQYTENRKKNEMKTDSHREV